jgi:fatty acid amide hydrolase 2
MAEEVPTRWLTQSGAALAAAIRAGEVTSREVVATHIAQARRANPSLNAIVCDRYDEALSEADAADALTRTTPAGELPPYHGVPCTVKESFAFGGMPNSAGLLARRDVVAASDCVTVARLRATGAIPLGVTNTSELCMWMESSNNVYGTTNNPYDLHRTVGGSSGGEGAAVAAGIAPFGLGSDIGGSIRLPAFFNGVFGHKPTPGIVPNTGQYPYASGPLLRYQCTGPLARHAEDLMPLLRGLSGPDGVDNECVAGVLGDPRTVDLSSLEVVVIEGNDAPLVSRVSVELLDAQRRAARALDAAGATVRTTQLAGLKRSFDIWSSMMAAGSEQPFRTWLGDGTPIHAGRELLRLAAGRSPYTLPALGLSLVERLPELMPARRRRLIALGAQLREELHELIGPRGVLLYPPYPRTAPPHRRAWFAPFDWVYTAIFNVAELPVTQVPLGLGRGGLPLGVQVASLPGHDHVTIAVALELERALGGWVPPPTWLGR